MGVELLEIEVQVRKFAIFAVRTCYRYVHAHPFMVGMVFFLIFLCRLFPFVLPLLVSASPVLVSTAVLLGTLLSFGQPNIPEIEKQEKTTHDFVSLKTRVPRDDIVVEKSIEETSLIANTITEVDKNDSLVDSVIEEEERELCDMGFELNEDKLGDGEVNENRFSPIHRLGNDDLDRENDNSPMGSIDSRMAERELRDKGFEQNSELNGDKQGDVEVDENQFSSIQLLGNDNHDMGNDNSPLGSIDSRIADLLNFPGHVEEGEEDDQKNPMNLGSLELERNRRLESLITRRRARKNLRTMAEKNLIDLESDDFSFNITPISTTRRNPFDLSYNSNDNVPGSAPSVMLARRNPFDLPYDPSEEKPDLMGDTFQHEFVSFQSKELFFRRHESFNVGPSIFGACWEETSYSAFHRQSSELSDSKLSSVPETDLMGSAKMLIVEDFSQEAEMISDTERASEHDGHGSESPKDLDSLDLCQVEKRDFELDEIEIKLGDVENNQEMESSLSETKSVAIPVELNASEVEAVEQKYSSGSSSSSLSEENEKTFNEKEGEGLSCLVDDTQHKEPVYDSSPPPFKKNLSSSFVSSDLQVEMPEMGLSPVLFKRIISFAERKSGAIDLSVENDTHGNEGTLVNSSELHAPDENESGSGEVTQLSENDVKEFGFSEFDQHYDIASASIMPESVVRHASVDPKPSLDTLVEEDLLHQDESFHQGVDEKVEFTASSFQFESTEDQNLAVTFEEQSLVIEQISLTRETESVEEHLMDKEVDLQFEGNRVYSSNSDVNFHVGIHQAADEKLVSTHYHCVSDEKILLESEKSTDEPSSENCEELQEPLIIQMESIDKVSTTYNLNVPEVQASIPESTAIPFEVTETKAPPGLVDLKDTLDEVENGDRIWVTEATDSPVEATYSHADMQSVEDGDEMKEIDEGLLLELDAVGDFSVEDSGSNLNEIGKQLVFSGESFLVSCANETNSFGVVEGDSIEIYETKVSMNVENIRPSKIAEEMGGSSELQMSGASSIECVGSPIWEFVHRQIENPIDLKSVDDEPPLPKQTEVEPVDSRIKQNPNAEEIVSGIPVVEMKEIEDIESSSGKAEPVSMETKVKHRDSEIPHQDQVVTNFGIPVLEARSLEDIDSAFKQINEKEVEKPIVVEMKEIEYNERQSSELSDSKVSSVPETESMGSARDVEDEKLIEEEFSQEAELISNGHGSESPKDLDSLELCQVEKREIKLDEIEIKLEDVGKNQDMESSLSEIESAVNPVELNVNEVHLSTEAVEQKNSSRSTSLSLLEENGKMFDETDGVSSLEPIRGKVIEEPVISMQYLVEKLDSFAERESEASNLSIENDTHAKEETLVDSSELHGVDENELGSGEVTQFSKNDVKEFGFSGFDQNSDCSSASIIPESVVRHASVDPKPSSDTSVEEDLLHQDEKVEFTAFSFQFEATEDPNLAVQNEEQSSVIEKISRTHPNTSFETESAEEYLMDKEVGLQFERNQVSSNSDVNFHVGIHQEADEKLVSTHYNCVSEENILSQSEKELLLCDKSMDEPCSENPEELQEPLIIELESVDKASTTYNLNVTEVQELDNKVSPNIYSPSTPESIAIPYEATETKSSPGLADLKVTLDEVENGDRIWVIEATDSHVDVKNNVEDADEIKEIDEGLLLELDVVGDFSVNDSGSNSNEIENQLESSGESFLLSCDNEINSFGVVEDDSIEIHETKVSMDVENPRSSKIAEEISKYEGEMEGASELRMSGTSSIDRAGSPILEFVQREVEYPIDLRSVNDEPPLPKKTELVEPVDSRIKQNPYAEEIISGIPVVEMKEIEDFESSSGKAEPVSMETEVRLRESEIPHQGQVETNFEMPVLEAQSLEDIDSAFKQINVKEAEKPIVVEMNAIEDIESSSGKAEPVSLETEVGLRESDILHQGQVETNFEMPVLEARSLEDIDSAFKQINEKEAEKLFVVEMKAIEDIESSSGKAEPVSLETEVGLRESDIPHQGQVETNFEMPVLEARSLQDIDSAFKQINEKEIEKPIVVESIEFEANEVGSSEDIKSGIHESVVQETSIGAAEIPNHEVKTSEDLSLSTSDVKGKKESFHKSSSSSSCSSSSSSSDSDRE